MFYSKTKWATVAKDPRETLRQFLRNCPGQFLTSDDGKGVWNQIRDGWQPTFWDSTVTGLQPKVPSPLVEGAHSHDQLFPLPTVHLKAAYFSWSLAQRPSSFSHSLQFDHDKVTNLEPECSVLGSTCDDTQKVGYQPSPGCKVGMTV